MELFLEILTFLSKAVAIFALLTILAIGGLALWRWYSYNHSALAAMMDYRICTLLKEHGKEGLSYRQLAADATLFDPGRWMYQNATSSSPFNIRNLFIYRYRKLRMSGELTYNTKGHTIHSSFTRYSAPKFKTI